MKQAGHIFNPKDDSLESRVEAYFRVQQEWLNIEASLKHWDAPEWQNTLGEHQELEEAHEIVLNSLQKATQAISVEEIDQAKEKGLMNDDEAYLFVQEKLDQQRGVNKSLNQENTQSRGLKL